MSGAAKTWHGPGQAVRVGPWTVPGMAYVWPNGRIPCAIDPLLPLGDLPFRMADLPRYASYSAITPEQRTAYLRWLSRGADDPEQPIGYVFLRFYGLERRLLLGNPPPSEEAALLAEVGRLLRIYGSHAAFRRYARALLDHVSLRSVALGQPWKARPSPSGELADADHLALERCAGRSAPAPLLARVAALLSGCPEGQRPLVASRAEEMLSRSAPSFLFVPPAPPGGPRVEFPAYLPGMHGMQPSPPPVRSVPHGLSRPWTHLSALAVAALSTLPGHAPAPPVRPGGGQRPVPKPAPRRAPAPPLPSGSLDWLRALGPHAVRPLREVCARMLGGSAERPTMPQLKKVAETLRRLGYAMEPDPEFSPLGAPPPGAEALVYRRAVPAPSDPAPPRWFTASLALSVAGPSPERAAALAEAMDFRPAQRERLEACARHGAGALSCPPRALWKAAREREGGDPAPVLAAALALLGAAADPAAAALFEAECRRAGTEDPHGLLHRAAAMPPAKARAILSGREGGMASLALPAPGRANPAVPQAGPALDPEQLERIRRETEAASALLGEVFAEDEPVPPAPAPSREEGGPPARYAGLAALLRARQGQSMPRAEWDAECRRAGVGGDGALDALNEWAEDRSGEPWLDLGEDEILVGPWPEGC